MKIALIQDSNPFIAEFECSNCTSVKKRIDEFPGGRCIDCHAAHVSGEPPVSAEEIAHLFGSGLLN